MVNTTQENNGGSQAQVVKDEALERAHEIGATTSEHAAAVKDEAKDKAVDVARDVRRELETQGDAQAKRAASALRDVGSQLRTMAENGQPGAVTDVTREVADRSSRLASHLEDRGVQGVSDDLRRFARRQPGVFLAVAGLAGFVVTRVLRNAQAHGDSAPPVGSVAPAALPAVGNGAPTDRATAGTLQ